MASIRGGGRGDWMGEDKQTTRKGAHAATHWRTEHAYVIVTHLQLKAQ